MLKLNPKMATLAKGSLEKTVADYTADLLKLTYAA